MLGMSNKRDGGVIVIGVEENERRLIFSGVSEEIRQTWSHDDVSAFAAPFADPSIEFDLRMVELNKKLFVVIKVGEFLDIPILCVRDYPDVLRQGACYVRSFRKPETSEIPTQTEMRDLLDLASDKKLRDFVRKAHAAGLITPQPPPPTDHSLYDQQKGPFQ